jgi:hypothetical protein
MSSASAATKPMKKLLKLPKESPTNIVNSNPILMMFCIDYQD